MTTPALFVERAHMALSEVGLPTEAVYLDDDGVPRCRRGLVPPRIIYKVRRIVRTTPELCFSCWDGWTDASSPPECAAPWLDDCEATT